MTSRKKRSDVYSVGNPSLFRYPGGKSWLIPYVRQWLGASKKRLHFAEPFAGGVNVGLAVAIESLADRVTLVELDPDVAAVWETTLNGKAPELAQRIVEFRRSKRAVEELLARRCNSTLSRAFATIVKNRARRGGIMTDAASLLKHGEDGKGGKIETAWFAFGDYDVVVITEMPNNVNAAAIAIAFAAGGACKAVQTTPLLSTAEAVEAMKKAKDSGYRPASSVSRRAA